MGGQCVDITYFDDRGGTTYEYAACTYRWKDNEHKREVESDSYAVTENKALNVIRCMHIYL